jgi:hypothetical protein
LEERGESPQFLHVGKIPKWKVKNFTFHGYNTGNPPTPISHKKFPIIREDRYFAQTSVPWPQGKSCPLNCKLKVTSSWLVCCCSQETQSRNKECLGSFYNP